MLKKSIAVFVSGGGTNLKALIEAQHNGIIENGKIDLVVSSNQAAYALQRAKDNNIETYIMTDEQSLIKLLDGKSIDLIVLAGFLKILSSDFINHYKDRVINVHPSLIPSFCGKGYYGLRVHEEALKYGVKITGATVHLVNEIPDGGRILSQKPVQVLPDDTPESLQKRVMEEAEWIILPNMVEYMCKEVL